MINLNNWPNDWQIGDRFKIMFKLEDSSVSPYIQVSSTPNQAIEFEVSNLSASWTQEFDIMHTHSSTDQYIVLRMIWFQNFNSNTPTDTLFRLQGVQATSTGLVNITIGTLSDYVYKMWRCRAS